jgi:hypothetical protein
VSWLLTIDFAICTMHSLSPFPYYPSAHLLLFLSSTIQTSFILFPDSFQTWNYNRIGHSFPIFLTNLVNKYLCVYLIIYFRFCVPVPNLENYMVILYYFPSKVLDTEFDT